MAFVALLERYGDRAQHLGTDKVTTHSYGEVYEAIFADLKARGPGVTVLENGVYGGAFLAAAAEFLPDARFHGVDISLANVRFGRDHPRIRLHEMDGTRRETAEAIGLRFDLIVEDGSHLPDHQVASLDAFAPFLKSEGVYVLEDIDGAHADELRPRLAATAATHGLEMEWLDLRGVKGRWDDILAIFRRGPTEGGRGPDRDARAHDLARARPPT